jgi:hypothetical protein
VYSLPFAEVKWKQSELGKELEDEELRKVNIAAYVQQHVHGE